ncbi:Protein of unknown function, partial [Gryllus bimaculatus]
MKQAEATVRVVPRRPRRGRHPPRSRRPRSRRVPACRQPDGQRAVDARVVCCDGTRASCALAEMRRDAGDVQTSAAMVFPVKTNLRAKWKTPERSYSEVCKDDNGSNQHVIGKKRLGLCCLLGASERLRHSSVEFRLQRNKNYVPSEFIQPHSLLMSTSLTQNTTVRRATKGIPESRWTRRLKLQCTWLTLFHKFLEVTCWTRLHSGREGQQLPVACGAVALGRRSPRPFQNKHQERTRRGHGSNPFHKFLKGQKTKTDATSEDLFFQSGSEGVAKQTQCQYERAQTPNSR